MIIGNGTQGKKNIKLKQKYQIYVYDLTLNLIIKNWLINLNNYNAVFLCVPDNKKFDYIDLFLKKLRYSLRNPTFS